jgi:hypothetical protein
MLGLGLSLAKSIIKTVTSIAGGLWNNAEDKWNIITSKWES